MRLSQRAPYGLVWALARRYLGFGRRRRLRSTAGSALGSTGLGVVAMVVAMALMNGYTESVQEKMLRSGALIVIPAFLGADDSGPGPERLREHPEVADVTYAVFAQGALTSQRHPQGLDLLLRGVVPGEGRFGGSVEELAVADDGVAGIVLGRDLARRLEVADGEILRLVVPDFGGSSVRFRYRSVRVTGRFATGFAEFDRRYAVMARDIVEGLSSGSGLYEVAIDDPRHIDQVAAFAEELLGERYLVRDWRRSNPGLFTALRLQKWVLFLVLGLIVVVSTFNVVSTLAVLVREKTRDIGVLAALGMRERRIRRVFVVCGLLLGATGTALGLSAGWALAWVLTAARVLRFDAEVAAIYFIDAVPFRVHVLDLAAIAAFSMTATLAASFLTARRAAAVEPAEALRYE